MNDKRKVLGRGLDSLLPGRTGTATAVLSPSELAAPTNEIRVDLIDPNPYQTRKKIDPEALKEMAESIKAVGVVQPILVRPLPNGHFQLVAGQRRLTASKMAGKHTVPVVSRELSNEQAIEITIIENLQREDLNPVEQARAFDRLSKEFGLTHEEIAARTGKDRASVTNFVRLLKLPETVQEFLENGELSLGHGKALCSLAGFVDQVVKVAHEIIAKKLSVRQTEDLVARILNPETPEEKQPQAKPVDPNVREAARTLKHALGVKVEIHDRKGKGRIILRYGSLDDFDRILEALSPSHH